MSNIPWFMAGKTLHHSLISYNGRITNIYDDIKIAFCSVVFVQGIILVACVLSLLTMR